METYKMVIYIIGSILLLVWLVIFIADTVAYFHSKRLIKEINEQTAKRKYQKKYYCE